MDDTILLPFTGQLPKPYLALLAPLPIARPLDNSSLSCQEAHRSAHHTCHSTAPGHTVTHKHTQTQRTYKYHKQTQTCLSSQDKLQAPGVRELCAFSMRKSKSGPGRHLLYQLSLLFSSDEAQMPVGQWGLGFCPAGGPPGRTFSPRRF